MDNDSSSRGLTGPGDLPCRFRRRPNRVAVVEPVESALLRREDQILRTSGGDVVLASVRRLDFGASSQGRGAGRIGTARGGDETNGTYFGCVLGTRGTRSELTQQHSQAAATT